MSKSPGAQNASQVADIHGLLRREKQAFANTLARSGNKLRETLEEERKDIISSIRRAADTVRESIAEREMELCCDVNEAFESERRKRERETVRISQRVVDIAQSVEDFLSKAPGEVAFKEQASLLGQIASIRELNDQLEQKEVHNNFPEKPVRFNPDYHLDISLGTVRYLGETADVKEAKGSSAASVSTPLDSVVRYSKHGKLVNELELPVELRRNFIPWVVSVSTRGLIGVVDRGNANVILFDENGQFVRLIEHPWKYATTSRNEIFGMTFLSDDSIVVAYYNSGRGSGSMELFDRTGKHHRYLAPLARPAYITAGAEDCIAVVYCLGYENGPPVQFFNKDGSARVTPRIPEGSLTHPHKAVVHRNTVFVASSDPRKNATMVKVYDHAGCLVTKLEMREAWKISGIGHPLRIAIDPAGDSLFVSHFLSEEVNVYSCSSRELRAQIRLPRGIVDLSVTSSNQLVATFGKGCDSPSTVKIFSLCD